LNIYHFFSKIQVFIANYTRENLANYTRQKYIDTTVSNCFIGSFLTTEVKNSSSQKQNSGTKTKEEK